MSNGRDYDLRLNAFESGMLLMMLYERLSEEERAPLKELTEQLRGHQRAIQEEAGVVVAKQAGLLRLSDKDGNVIIRQPYPWEDY